MTTQPPNRRTSDVERQLAAMASARERANNPRSLLVLGGLALVVGLIVVIWAMISVAGARARFAGAENRAQRWAEQLATIESLSGSAPDLAELYPISSFIKSDYEGIVRQMWPNQIPQLSVGTHQRRRTIPDSAIEQWEIEVNSNATGVELDRFMQFINAAIEKQGQKPTFVSHISLVPVPSSANWRATTRIGMYQVSLESLRSAE